MSAPIAVGLVGAGPWAHEMHAPILAAGPETALVAVWARRPSAREELASAFGAHACGSFDELLDRCEAVAFAVPPDVQAALGVLAAKAGKALLLEKPIALSLVDATRLASAAGEAGVVTQLVLTRRYHPATREFLARAAGFRAAGALARHLHGALLDGPYATPWRLEHGVLLDLAPHSLDLLDAVLGPIAEIRAAGDPRTWVTLTCEHESGVISTAALSGTIGTSCARIELFGPDGALTYKSTGQDPAPAWATLRSEFADAVRSRRSHELDVHRGLYLQRLIERAAPVF
jgi:predicted dehydrogenase